MHDLLEDFKDYLAVVGHADEILAHALLNDGAADFPARFAAAQAAWATDPELEAGPDGWALAGDLGAARLAGMEERDPARYAAWHERAIDALAQALRGGRVAAEPILIQVFDRYASVLVNTDPSALRRLIARIKDVALTPGRGAQIVAYFDAVVLYRGDSLDQAITRQDAFLATPALDEELRGRVLNSRGIDLRKVGRFEEAARDLSACLLLWRQRGDRLGEGKAQLNLAILHYELRRYDACEACLIAAQQCFTEMAARKLLTRCRHELGLLYRDQGRLDEALAQLALCAAELRADADWDAFGRALNNQGEVLLFMGRFEEAEETLRAALEHQTSLDHVVDTWLYLGLARQIAGDLDGAAGAFGEALETCTRLGRAEILPEVHYRLGEVRRRLGRDEAALEHFATSARIIEDTRVPLRDEALKIGLAGRWQQVYESLVLRCLALGRTADAFAWSERARARAFDDAIARRLGAAERESTGTPSPANGTVTLAEVQAALPADALLLATFTTGVLEHDIPLARVIAAQPALREHLLAPARTVVFAITSERAEAHFGQIDPNHYVGGTPRGGDPGQFLATAVARRIYADLIAPAAAGQPGGIWFIISHGPLHRVPFAALQTANAARSDDTARHDDDPYLLRAGGPRLIYSPSATVLVRHGFQRGPADGPPAGSLAIGYNSRAGATALRHSEAEARFVARITGGEAWTGPEPKAARLRDAAATKRWLHFACHGAFLPERPLDSFLETGAPGPGAGEGTDGEERLTAAEVVDTWRLHAELVVLSACETGLARVLRGDEPLGLVRAFLAAGAGAVLVSQWEVGDLPTFLLMQRFYVAMVGGGGLGPAAALQLAQVWLRELTVAEALGATEDPRWPEASADDLRRLVADRPADARPFADPRDWAGFVLVGGTG